MSKTMEIEVKLPTGEVCKGTINCPCPSKPGVNWGFYVGRSDLVESESARIRRGNLPEDGYTHFLGTRCPTITGNGRFDPYTYGGSWSNLGVGTGTAKQYVIFYIPPQ